MTDGAPFIAPNMHPSYGVELKDSSVNVVDIDGALTIFLAVAGTIHSYLFNAPLVVTSGRDGNHVASSKHGEGKALDIRVSDLPPSGAPAWLLCLRVLAERYKLGVFDESYAPGMGHIHVEIAG